MARRRRAARYLFPLRTAGLSVAGGSEAAGSSAVAAPALESYCHTGRLLPNLAINSHPTASIFSTFSCLCPLSQSGQSHLPPDNGTFSALPALPPPAHHESLHSWHPLFVNLFIFNTFEQSDRVLLLPVGSLPKWPQYLSLRQVEAGNSISGTQASDRGPST